MLGGPGAMVPLSDRRAGHPRRRASSARMAASSAGSAWSQPHRWSVPWTASSRSSSEGAQRRSPVWPPRPATACSIARSTEMTTSPRWRRRPGGNGKAAGAAALAGRPRCAFVRGNASGGRSGNERTSVGPRVPRWARVERGQLRVVGQDQPDRRRRRRAGDLGRRSHAASQGGPGDRRLDPVADRQVDPPGPEVERSAHEAEPPPPPVRPPAARRDSSSTTVFCG